MIKKTHKKPSTGNQNRRKRAAFDKKSDKVYLEGIVSESLPGVKFKVKVERSKGLEPLVLECQTKTLLKVKRVKILKGDAVLIELDPLDLSKGLIVARS